MRNVLNTIKQVHGVTHPLIADMYLKQGHSSKNDNVLVIETHRLDKDCDGSINKFDHDLTDLYLDLDDLKTKAESKVGKFNRIDIRSAA